MLWGTGVDPIISHQGDPAFRGKDYEEVTLLGYPVTIAGQQTHAMFFAHPRHGLFRVGYIAEFTDAAQCTFKLEMFDQGHPAATRRSSRGSSGLAGRGIRASHSLRGAADT